MHTHLASLPRGRLHGRRARARRWLAVALLVAAAGLQLVAPRPAAAAVTRLHGFWATVDGWTSWYGSYGLGDLGPGWCIDHGSRAPDPAFRYAATDLAGVPEDVRAAVGWVVGRHGHGADPVAHAAGMLAVHDLMGARYPSGRLDVDRLTPARTAGFGPQAGAVLDRARQLKAEGLAHRHLRGPLALALTPGEPQPDGRRPVVVRLHDRLDQGVGGVAVTLTWPGRTQVLTTDARGTATVVLGPSGAPTEVRAAAVVPHLPVDAWAPTATPAQRVARPTRDELTAVARVAPSTGRLRIDKAGDATAYVPVAGARFAVVMAGGGAPVELVVGEDGRTPEVELPIGSHQVVEVEPPPGYLAAGPWTVDVRPGEVAMLEVLDRAVRGEIRLRKVDAATGDPLGFAGLTLRYDADADGAFDGAGDPVVAEVLSSRDPVVVADLLPGRYELREDLTPTGYQPLAEPLVVHLAPGQTLDLEVPNAPVPPPPTTTEPPATTTTSTTTTTTTAPPSSTTTSVAAARPPVTVAAGQAPPPAPIGRLPRTGADTASLALAGAGLVLLGWAATDAARLRARTGG